MKKFNNAEEITKAFIADGWKNDTVLVDYTADEAKTEGLFGIYNEICNNGKKFFKMTATGNIFDDTGNIAYYNIKTLNPPIAHQHNF